MAKITTISTALNTNDATFRAWGSEFSGSLSAVGLVQTSDTGQINWTTVTWTASNAMQGYEIWRLNDSMQSSFPIYLKFFYGTQTTNGQLFPGMTVTIGTGSDGAGNITGVLVANTFLNTYNIASGSVTSQAATGLISRFCCVDGMFWLCSKDGMTSGLAGALGYLILCRTSDSSGTPTADGVHVIYVTNASVFCKTILANGTSINTTLDTTPATPSSTIVAGAAQVWRIYSSTPAIAPLFGVCAAYRTELPNFAQFSAAVVGSTPRTFVSLASAVVMPAASRTFCLIWE